MKKGDRVEILVIIYSLQPHNYRTKDGFHKQYGTITAIDGHYISVRPKRRRWEIECYPNELKVITKEEFKKVENIKKYEH